MTLVILALVSFVQVFALGFQSRNVNHGNYGWAAGPSCGRRFTLGRVSVGRTTRTSSP